MGNKTRNVRYPGWIQKAVSAFARKNGFSTDSKAFIWLLTASLNKRGYYEEDYTDMIDKPEPDTVPTREVMKKAQKINEKKVKRA